MEKPHKDYYSQLIMGLENHLQDIQLDHPDKSDWAKISIPVVHGYLELLKEHVQAHPFPNRSEEIYFFKHVKPCIVAKLVYCCELYNLLAAMPGFGREEKLTFLSNKLDYLNAFLANNADLYDYYQAGDTEVDHKLFCRKVRERFSFRGLPLPVDPVYFYGDPSFSTGFDFVFAQFMAYEQLIAFIAAQRVVIETENGIQESPIQFTGTKGDFVELVSILRAVAEPVDEEGKPVSEEEVAQIVKEMLNADWGTAEDFQTLKLISGSSDLPERLMEGLERVRRKWLEEDEEDQGEQID